MRVFSANGRDALPSEHGKLLADTPTLMRLRELEVLESIAKQGKLNIVLDEKGLTDRPIYRNRIGRIAFLRFLGDLVVIMRLTLQLTWESHDMPSYICLTINKCPSCKSSHDVYIDAGKACPSRRIDFKCPDTGESIMQSGYPCQAFILHSRVPKDGSKGKSRTGNSLASRLAVLGAALTFLTRFMRLVM